MKHFVIYRKLILIIGTATAVVSVGVFFFMEDILFRTLFISFAFVFFGGLLFLLDFLHNRYNDNLLEEITLLIEALVEQQERTVWCCVSQVHKEWFIVFGILFHFFHCTV